MLKAHKPSLFPSLCWCCFIRSTVGTAAHLVRSCEITAPESCITETRIQRVGFSMTSRRISEISGLLADVRSIAVLRMCRSYLAWRSRQQKSLLWVSHAIDRAQQLCRAGLSWLSNGRLTMQAIVTIIRPILQASGHSSGNEIMNTETLSAGSIRHIPVKIIYRIGEKKDNDYHACMSMSSCL